MKKIVNGKLYDTEKATLIYADRYSKRQYFKTANGNYFTLYCTGEIMSTTEEHIKDILGELDVEKYIELFGNVEEA